MRSLKTFWNGRSLKQTGLDSTGEEDFCQNLVVCLTELCRDGRTCRKDELSITASVIPHITHTVSHLISVGQTPFIQVWETYSRRLKVVTTPYCSQCVNNCNKRDFKKYILKSKHVFTLSSWIIECRLTFYRFQIQWHIISAVGFNPAWNENFEFDVCMPDLALVRFVVEDYDSMSENEFIGQYTLPFNSLKMGKCCLLQWIFAVCIYRVLLQQNDVKPLIVLCFHTS